MRIMKINSWHCRINWYLFAGFKTIILRSFHFQWFVKYMFSAKISFVKTSTSIVKYESRVVKSNPGCLYYDSFIMIICLVDAGTRNILLSDVLVGTKRFGSLRKLQRTSPSEGLLEILFWKSFLVFKLKLLEYLGQNIYWALNFLVYFFCVLLV